MEGSGHRIAPPDFRSPCLASAESTKRRFLRSFRARILAAPDLDLAERELLYEEIHHHLTAAVDYYQARPELDTERAVVRAVKSLGPADELAATMIAACRDARRTTIGNVRYRARIWASYLRLGRTLSAAICATLASVLCIAVLVALSPPFWREYWLVLVAGAAVCLIMTAAHRQKTAKSDSTSVFRIALAPLLFGSLALSATVIAEFLSNMGTLIGNLFGYATFLVLIAGGRALSLVFAQPLLDTLNSSVSCYVTLYKYLLTGYAAATLLTLGAVSGGNAKLIPVLVLAGVLSEGIALTVWRSRTDNAQFLLRTQT